MAVCHRSDIDLRQTKDPTMTPPSDTSAVSDLLLLDLTEAARRLGGISTRTVRRLIECGELPSVRVGRRITIPIAALRTWVAKQCPLAHTHGGAGEAVPEEKRTCQESANVTKTEFSPVRTRRSGGRAIQTEAANRLADLLEFDVKRTQKGSRPGR